MNKMSPEDQIKNYLDGIYTKEDIDQVFDQLSRTDRFDDYSHRMMDEAEKRVPVSGPGVSESYRAEARRLLMELEQPVREVPVPKHRYRKRIAVGVAATLLLLLAAGAVWLMLPRRDSRHVVPEYAELVTGTGEIKHLLLDDGTAVTLNACSRLRYPSNMRSGADRQVRVDGQAFFKVARDENRPFHVMVDNINITVLGTEFDVKSYAADEMSSIKVKSGKVSVELPEATMILVKDQQMLYSHSSNDFSRRSGPVEADCWCRGELLFANASIADVARELERKFGCTIRLDPNSVFTNRLTGSHRGHDLGAILQSLHYVANVGFRTDRNGDIILYSMDQ